MQAGTGGICPQYSNRPGTQATPTHAPSALAIELGLIFAALTLALRTRDGDRNLRLYGAVALFVMVSGFANLDAVLSVTLGQAATLEAVQALDRW